MPKTNNYIPIHNHGDKVSVGCGGTATITDVYEHPEYGRVYLIQYGVGCDSGLVWKNAPWSRIDYEPDNLISIPALNRQQIKELIVKEKMEKR